MDDRSTISWMIMGGPRYDEPSQGDIDHLRALQDQDLEGEQAGTRGRIARSIALLDRWTARPASALTSDYCSTNCTAA